MATYRKYVRIAGLLFAIVSPAFTASRLAAQGGRQARRATPVRAAEPEASPATLLEPARSMLRHLVGQWRVEIRFAGNFDGAPDAAGTRVVSTQFDDLRLQWTEQLDSAQTRAQGTIGFDSRTGRFFGTAVDSTGSGAELLFGTLDVAEPVITFRTLEPPGPIDPDRLLNGSYVLRMVDQDHFTWAPLNRGWRAVFTRLAPQ